MDHPSLIKTEEMALSTVRNLPLEFPPGSALKYSNTNYVLLGLVLDKVARKMGLTNHAALLRAQLLVPLGLKSTFYEVKEANSYQTNRIVSGVLGGADFSKIQQGYGLANGGLLSNVKDVAVFFHALSSEGALSTIGDLMMPALDENFGYGLYRMDPNGNSEIVGHTGEFAGYLTFAAYDSLSGTSIVGFANSSDASAQAAFSKMRQYLLNRLNQ
jgi:CubicO group peptidase (beta-lactamase class C family)